MFSKVAKLYSRQVSERPLITQIVTAGTMITISDVITQQLIERKRTHDFQRTAIMGLCGLLYFGPLNGKWFMLLNRSKLPATICVALDQVWIPAQAVNFYIIPFQFRMFFLQAIALMWNCYLSNKANTQKNVE